MDPPPDNKQTNVLVDKFKRARSTKRRVEALVNLAAESSEGDPEVRRIIEDATTDTNDSVRAQAYASLATLDKTSTNEVLGRALHDKAPEVRVAAVDTAENNRQVLEQAAHDADPGVRDFANAKLSELSRREQRHQNAVPQGMK
jgi:HEAT repeat protein